MWTRARIKQEAKGTLRRYGYWMPLLVSFLLTLVSGGNGYVGGGITGSTTEYTADVGTGGSYAAFAKDFAMEISDFFEEFFSNPLILMTTVFFVVLAFLLGLAFSFAWSSLLYGPALVGKNRFYMEHRGFEPKFVRIFYGFSKNYLNVAKISFLMQLKVFLWSLLFIIPGWIKHYQYYMVPYILAENPNISSKRAFEISKKMTDGEKWRIFVLELSFIGWEIVGMLCCYVGIYFLLPYYEATFAELYQVMREKAHGTGIADYSELPGFCPED